MKNIKKPLTSITRYYDKRWIGDTEEEERRKYPECAKITGLLENISQAVWSRSDSNYVKWYGKRHQGGVYGKTT